MIICGILFVLIICLPGSPPQKNSEVKKPQTILV